MDPIERNKMLDISADFGIFSSMIAEKMKAEKLVFAFRNSDDRPSIKGTEKFQISVKNGDYGALQSLGKFDTIIVKEILHECDDLAKFFEALKSNLQEPIKSKIFISTRPKNPPLPLPNPALEKWRKYAPTREEIVDALKKVGYEQESFHVSCPIRISKYEWKKILMGRFLPVIRNSEKCTDKVIGDYIKGVSDQIRFEEKVLMIVAWLK